MVFFLLLIFFLRALESARHKDNILGEYEYITGEHIVEWITNKNLVPVSEPLLSYSAMVLSGFGLSPKNLLPYRAMMVLSFCGAGLLLWRWARELYGSWAGILALSVYTLSPNVLAYSRLYFGNPAQMVFGFVMCFCLWRGSAGRRMIWFACAGVALGLALLSRLGALLLLPAPFVVLLCLLKKQSREKGVGKLVGGSFVAFAVAIAVLNGGYLFQKPWFSLRRYRFTSVVMRRLQELPVVSSLPLGLPAPYVLDIDDRFTEMLHRSHPRNWYFFMGQHSREGWWYYFFVALSMKLTIPFLFLILMGLVARIRFREFNVSELYGLVPFSFVFLPLSFFLKPSDTISHILLFFPIAGLWVSYLVQWRGMRFIVAVLICWHFVEGAFIHPHYLPYANKIWGGPSRLHRYYLGDADWQNDWTAINRYLKSHPEVRVLPDPFVPELRRRLEQAGLSEIRGKLWYPVWEFNRPIFVTGTVGVSSSALIGSPEFPAFEWIDDFLEPIDNVGYTFFVFNITPDDLLRISDSSPEFRSAYAEYIEREQKELGR